jgi:hypothetical protein
MTAFGFGKRNLPLYPGTVTREQRECGKEKKRRPHSQEKQEQRDTRQEEEKEAPTARRRRTSINFS